MSGNNYGWKAANYDGDKKASVKGKQSVLNVREIGLQLNITLNRHCLGPGSRADLIHMLQIKQ